MEQTPYWMWTKRKSNTTSSQQQQQQQQQRQQQQQLQVGGSTKTSMSYNNDSSWEEQAFAEDAIGAFGGGGCVWPPRSYSCSFCRREFRSAQALGGHMNVHRRDRARLKQSSPPHHHHQSQLDHNINQNHLLGFDQYHHYHHHQQPNPNHPILASSWTSRVCDDQEISKRSPIFSSPTTWANFVVGRSSSDNKTSDDPKPQGCNKAKCVRTDLSVSLNLVLHQTHDPTMSSEDDDEEAMRRCKKKRRRNSIDASSSSFPFFLKPTHQAHDDHHEADDEHSPKTTSEDLDLELRLGRSP